jgi:ATP-dependent RNA helicase RhlE
LDFNSFKFTDTLMDGLNAMGFDKPTPIQEKSIPIILSNKDLIACAQTGTGKTAAFVLPVLHKLATSENNHLNTLILAPTRELALQIDQQIEGFSYFLGISSIPVYGGGDGEAFVNQKRALEQGAEIVIATPGRLIALLNSGKINFKNLKHLILDEADRMLDMGFYDDILRIISHLPKERQTILFSATMPPNIRKLANKIMIDPESVSIAISKPADGIKQKAIFVKDAQKANVLIEILKDTTFESIIVFVGTKELAKKLERNLKTARVDANAFHSDLTQSERSNLINVFKNRKVRALVGTDILSRGIDIDGIDLVINYDIPTNPDDYIHRIGRTARGDKFGTAIALVNEKDRRKFGRIQELTAAQIETENRTGGELVDAPSEKPFFKKKFPSKNFQKKTPSSHPSNG